MFFCFINSPIFNGQGEKLCWWEFKFCYLFSVYSWSHELTWFQRLRNWTRTRFMASLSQNVRISRRPNNFYEVYKVCVRRTKSVGQEALSMNFIRWVLVLLCGSQRQRINLLGLQSQPAWVCLVPNAPTHGGQTKFISSRTWWLSHVVPEFMRTLHDGFGFCSSASKR